MNRTAALSILLVASLLTVSSAKPHSTGIIVRIYADRHSNVHIVLNSGKEAVVPRQRDQVGIEDVKIADDGRTAGWVVSYAVPDDTSRKFAGSLVIWRNEKIVRTFDTGPTFWSWAFIHRGEQVAYHSGPLHEGPLSHCELRDVKTGRLLASWDGNLENPDRPDWTKALDH
jgi:hypothetical protein